MNWLHGRIYRTRGGHEAEFVRALRTSTETVRLLWIVAQVMEMGEIFEMSIETNGEGRFVTEVSEYDIVGTEPLALK